VRRAVAFEDKWRLGRIDGHPAHRINDLHGTFAVCTRLGQSDPGPHLLNAVRRDALFGQSPTTLSTKTIETGADRTSQGYRHTDVLDAQADQERQASRSIIHTLESTEWPADLEAQIVQRSPTEVRLLYVPAASAGDTLEAALRRRLEERLPGLDIELRAVERIARGPQGKFRAVIGLRETQSAS